MDAHADQSTSTSHEYPLEYRLVLIGRSGEGKSSTANSIFGKDVFDAFAAAGAVTSRCDIHTDNVHGRRVLVADTPGLFDPERSNDETKEELLKFLAYTSPGPHAILLVVKLGRFTPEVQATYKYVQSLLGNESNNHTLIVFTGGDNLEYDEVAIDEYLNTAPVSFKNMLFDVGMRYVVLNNRAPEEDKQGQVKNLLKKVEEVISINKGSCYGSSTYDDAEAALQTKESGNRGKAAKKKNVKEEKLTKQLAKKQEEIERLKKDAEANQELFEACKKYHEQQMRDLQKEYEEALLDIRNDLRKDIKTGKEKVSEPWFLKKLNRAGKVLKKTLHLD